MVKYPIGQKCDKKRFSPVWAEMTVRLESVVEEMIGAIAFYDKINGEIN